MLTNHQLKTALQQTAATYSSNLCLLEKCCSCLFRCGSSESSRNLEESVWSLTWCTQRVCRFFVLSESPLWKQETSSVGWGCTCELSFQRRPAFRCLRSFLYLAVLLRWCSVQQTTLDPSCLKISFYAIWTCFGCHDKESNQERGKEIVTESYFHLSWIYSLLCEMSVRELEFKTKTILEQQKSTS